MSQLNVQIQAAVDKKKILKLKIVVLMTLKWKFKLIIILNSSLKKQKKGEEQHDIEDQVRSQCNFNNEGDDRQITDLTQADTSITTTEDDLSGSLIGYTRATLAEIYDLNSGKKKVKQEGKSGQTIEESTTNICQTVQESTVESCQTTEESKTKTKKRKRRRVAITRTDCHALIKAKLNSEGQFEITQHSLVHNHPLTRQQWNHLHRSERMMTSEKGSAIKSMQESGLRPMESFQFMLAEVGGEQFIGHTVRDHLNYCNKLKMKPIEGGDAQAIIDKLYQKVADDMEFFFRVHLDQEGKVCNIFWRDSVMKEDYSVYGDITIFDTTYRTNRYNLICAPFTGINSHWKNIMFGCAFLGDEKIESFVWLFETFKKSMGGKCPITIFTDQDTLMSKAIEKVFPDSRHRLCLWDLNQNAVSRFGALKRITSFKDVFQKCLSGCSNEEDFEKTWHEIVVEYKLEKSKWFNKCYKLEEKWATTLCKDFFQLAFCLHKEVKAPIVRLDSKLTKEQV